MALALRNRTENQVSDMTIEQLQLLSDEELRVMCAELCGYKIHEWGITYPDEKESGRGYVSVTDLLPNYPADLNAMHEAEKTLTETEAHRYHGELCDVRAKTGHGTHVLDVVTYHATGRQRCIAFIAVKRSSREEGGE